MILHGRSQGCMKSWPQRLIVLALRDYKFGVDALETDATPLSVLYDRYVEQYRSDVWPEWNQYWDEHPPHGHKPWMPMIPSVIDFGVELNYAIDGAWMWRTQIRIGRERVWGLKWCKGPGSRVLRAYRKPSCDPQYDWSEYEKQNRAE